MIKAVITGADTPTAGELIRILVNHPDVELTALVAPGQEGKQAMAIHHGLVGEEKMTFTSFLPQTEPDVVFITDAPSMKDLATIKSAYPNAKSIVLNFNGETSLDGEQVVYGLPEIYRKNLVRTATTALIPNPIASALLVALYPLALNTLLREDINISVSSPEDISSDKNLAKAKSEIEREVSKAQTGYEGKVNFKAIAPTSKRGIELFVSFATPVGIEYIMNAYQLYDDHNFAFAVNSDVKLDDVKGTEKCLVSVALSRDGILSLHIVADGRLRGSAGEAVHIMNLMFGLHEKTGLYLKPYAF